MITAGIGGGGTPALKATEVPLLLLSPLSGFRELRQSWKDFCTCFNHGFCTLGPPYHNSPAGLGGGAFDTGDKEGNDAMACAGLLETLGRAFSWMRLTPPAEAILILIRLLQGGVLRYNGI